MYNYKYAVYIDSFFFTIYRLTASNFGAVCKMRAATSCTTIVKSILYQSFFGNPATMWGREHERVAIEEFSEKQKMEIKECGLFVHKKYPFLAATPDGLIGDRGVVEVKCPFSAAKYTPLEAINNKKIKFAFAEDSQLRLKRTHNYYYQVQGQLQITGREYCIFLVWTPLGMEFETVCLLKFAVMVISTS